MVALHVYVEGGGDTVAQRKPLRVALGQWIEAAVPEARGRVRVHPGGGRQETYQRFCTAIADSDGFCLLLVDSEEAVTAATRWQHVANREGDCWTCPLGVGEDNLHFMAQTMETWLCADPSALAMYFGQGFNTGKLPKRLDIEGESKPDVNSKLAAASRTSRRGPYDKGKHLDALARISPILVLARCPHAVQFVAAVRAHVKP
jgi:hypothetical protein